ALCCRTATTSRKTRKSLRVKHGRHRSKADSYKTGSEWPSFLRNHGIVCSMSRRGNCHDDAVVIEESL
ncbi:MAG: hypothetical protein WBW61_08260, partial [Rhodanobacteraceae bacterium]